MGPRWFQIMAWWMEKDIPRSTIAILFLALSISGQAWSLLEAGGVKGYPSLPILLIITSSFAVGLLLLLARAFRWTALFIATKQYLRSAILLDYDGVPPTVLIGAGGGSGIALGMVAKALKDLKLPEPETILLDGYYNTEKKPVIGERMAEDIPLEGASVLLVLSWIGTGAWLDKLRERSDLRDFRVFSFGLSKPAKGRKDVDYYLYCGERDILPWSRTEARRISQGIHNYAP